MNKSDVFLILANLWFAMAPLYSSTAATITVMIGGLIFLIAHIRMSL